MWAINRKLDENTIQNHWIMSKWNKISEQGFQQLVESVLQRLKADLKVKGNITRSVSRIQLCVPSVLLKLSNYIVLQLAYTKANILTLLIQW